METEVAGQEKWCLAEASLWIAEPRIKENFTKSQEQIAQQPLQRKHKSIFLVRAHRNSVNIQVDRRELQLKV